MNAEAEMIKAAQQETALAKRLLTLMKTPGVSWFFEVHPECDWPDFSAGEAWEAWIKGQLTDAECSLYEERYEYAYSTLQELRNELAVESNRVPGPGYADGY